MTNTTTTTTRNLEESVLTYGQAIGLFAAYNEAKNLSPNTITWYHNQLAHLANFMASNHPELTPATTDISHLRAMIASIQSRLASKSVNDTVVSSKTFFKFLVEEGYIDRSPAERLQKIKCAKTLIQPFSSEQIAAILQQPDKKRFSGQRDYTMLLVAFDCGLRLMELLTLRIDNIDFGQNLLKVVGKGNKERVVPFGRSVRFALATYLERRGELETNVCFVSELGVQMTTRSFQIALKQYGKAAKVTGVRVSPHTCRHSFATNWIRNGGDLMSLQRILGHATLDMVRTYVSLVTGDLQRAHQTYSPMDRMIGEVKQTTGRTRIR